MATFQLTVIDSFDASHSLPDHPGQCANLHGHTWRVEATWTFSPDEVDPATGIAADFAELKSRLRGVLPDHQHLNAIYRFTPTAENLARHFSEQLGGAAITLWESETACVTYQP